MKLLASGGDAGDDVGDVAEDSSEEQQTEEELEDDENVLPFTPWSGKVADGRQCESAPVVTLKVLLHDVRGLRVAEHPVLGTESVILIDNSVQAAVPMEDDQEVMDETRRTEQVGVVGVPFGPVHKVPEPVDLDEAERAKNGIESDGEIQKVERQEAEAVDVERRRIHIMGPQFGRVRLEDSVF